MQQVSPRLKYKLGLSGGFEAQIGRLRDWQTSYKYILTQEAQIDLKLLQVPRGASIDAMKTHENLEILSAAKFRKLAPLECPVVFDDTQTEVVVHSVWHGGLWFGQRNKHTGEWDGITRAITCTGSIVESQYKNNKKHGYCRSVGSDGTYREEFYIDGKLNGTKTIYDPHGKKISVIKYRDDQEIEVI